MYGRTGELSRLNKDRNNPSLGKLTRRRADMAYRKIAQQLKDRKLMLMRERLIKATVAGDQAEANKIQLQMRAYEGNDPETGV